MTFHSSGGSCRRLATFSSAIALFVCLPRSSLSAPLSVMSAPVSEMKIEDSGQKSGVGLKLTENKTSRGKPPSKDSKNKPSQIKQGRRGASRDKTDGAGGPSDSSRIGLGVGFPVVILPSLGAWIYGKLPESGWGVDAYFGQAEFSDPEFSFSGPSYGASLRYYPGDDGFYLAGGLRQRSIEVKDPEEFEQDNNGAVTIGKIHWQGNFRQMHASAMLGWNLPITAGLQFDFSLGVDLLMSSSLDLSYGDLDPGLLSTEELEKETNEEEDDLRRYLASPVMPQLLLGVSWVFGS